MELAQIFIAPPLTPENKSLWIAPSTTTVGDLRNKIRNSKPTQSTISPSTTQRTLPNVSDMLNTYACEFFDSKNCFKKTEDALHCMEEVQLLFCGRYLKNDKALLIEEGITNGAVIRTTGQLKGGSSLKLTVITQFGWKCFCQQCFCLACRGGRKYEINVNSIDTVNTIYDAIAAQNPSYLKNNKHGTLVTESGVLLEATRKIIVYDLHDDSVLHLHVLPYYWFFKNYRKSGSATPQDPGDEEDEEYQANLAKIRAEEKMSE